MFKSTTNDLDDDARHAGIGPRSRLVPNAIGIVLIAAGLTLVAISLRSAWRVEDVNQSPPLALSVDSTDILQQEQALAGAFATGDDEGDRAIVIDVGGKVRLQELGPHGAVQHETAGTYRFGRRDHKLYLAVSNGGQIEAANRDTLVYYRDTYHRTR